MFKWVRDVDERLTKIETILVRNTATLEHHVKRTDELQNFVQVLPITLFKWGLALFAGIGTIVGVIYGSIQLIEKLTS
jgi:hypothetical protein